jgi:hypothetical protein
MAVGGLCHTACHTATNQQRDEAEALPAEPWYTPEISRWERLDTRGVQGAYANAHPHKQLVQVTMYTEHKLDEKGYANPRAYSGP